MHHAYSKHAEVTVPSLDDWEKEWGKAEGRMKNAECGARMPKAAVVQVDFRAEQDDGCGAESERRLVH